MDAKHDAYAVKSFGENLDKIDKPTTRDIQSKGGMKVQKVKGKTMYEDSNELHFDVEEPKAEEAKSAKKQSDQYYKKQSSEFEGGFSNVFDSLSTYNG